jgi:hypothetical protein
MTAVRSVTGQHGEVLHLIAAAPSALPAVTRRDLEQAWDAAHAGGVAGPYRGFRFTLAAAAPVELVLNDPDAAAWAAAIDRIASLSTAHGVSLCLRLLALVELMTRAAWARPWFSLGRAGAEVQPGLLLAAALAPLNAAGGFDEPALRALLPQATLTGSRT